MSHPELVTTSNLRAAPRCSIRGARRRQSPVTGGHRKASQGPWGYPHSWRFFFRENMPWKCLRMMTGGSSNGGKPHWDDLPNLEISWNLHFEHHWVVFLFFFSSIRATFDDWHRICPNLSWDSMGSPVKLKIAVPAIILAQLVTT